MRLFGFYAIAALLCCGAVSAPAATPDPDLANLQGQWVIVQSAYTPSDSANAVAAPLLALGPTIKINSDSTVSAGNGNQSGNSIAIVLNSGASPKTIDVNLSGQTLQGIYSLDSGVLSVALGVNGSRPTTLGVADDHVLFILKQPGDVSQTTNGN